MAKSSPKEPAVIQAELSRLRRRRTELNELIDRVERYLKFLAVAPASLDAKEIEEGPACRRKAA
jgi:hypothetical protein